MFNSKYSVYIYDNQLCQIAIYVDQQFSDKLSLHMSLEMLYPPQFLKARTAKVAINFAYFLL